jgi:hypothetical protein
LNLLYLREQECEGPWLFFVAKMSASKTVGKHSTRVFKCAHGYKSKGLGQSWELYLENSWRTPWRRIDMNCLPCFGAGNSVLKFIQAFCILSTGMCVCACACVCVRVRVSVRVCINNCINYTKLKICRFVFINNFSKRLHLALFAPCPRVVVFDEFHRTTSPVESAADTLPYRTLSNQKQ